jgi:alkanesulfonate monooxygenase SsuD/methylene tetrahydromethanopterin reductase-like flavin-dependent oxidoreductase (luciferase family)
MPFSVSRFNCIQPGMDRTELSARYQAVVEMAGYADEHGFTVLTLEEHHGIEDGYCPSPLVLAGLIFGRTTSVSVTISALLTPLHDPLRIAEDIAVLDLASAGRLMVIAGMGYRPEEYAMFAKDWEHRGALQDEVIDTMLKAWTAEPFEYRGTTVRVTPRPFTDPHPPLMMGGTSKPAARRAARFGLPLMTAKHMPELEAYYYAQCAEHGTQGFCMMPGEETVMMHVSEDPDRAWAELGKYFWHEASQYAGWQTPDIHSSVHSYAHDIASLREEGIYQVCTPDELVERMRAQGDSAACNLHPLVGGMPIDEGWKSLRLYVEQVLPKLA